MQGQLRKTPLKVHIQTSCACCKQSLNIEFDEKLNFRVTEQGADPIVFIPLIDFETLEDPSIIDAF
ncbi:MAG: hypothetical protein AB1894_13725 [Chloroflexota bacterium]